MSTTRFKGESGSDRLGVSTITDSDMIQVRHKPGTVDDADKGVSKAVLNSCPFGVSSTAAATAAKTAALTDSNPDFTLLSGREVVVYFSTANSAASPTLNFAGSGANPIYYPDGTAVGDWDAGTWMHLKYFEATIDNSLIQRWICLAPVVKSTIASGDRMPVSSDAVYNFPIDTIVSGEHRPATSNAVKDAINYDLLWENPNPSNALVETTLTAQALGVDLSKYQSLRVYTKNYITGGNYFVKEIIKGLDCYISAPANQIIYRRILFTNESIKIFDNSVITTYGQAGTVNNNLSIPVKIYGIK